eukprot:CAMPEP_0197938200 /NCGR_PEP_ID=MMETSP1439-20131203/117769_1 /TAXON_ID=66791 /ORGANISM="Gonyaulax spinifera, Strain CCMP409" /LENGTH=40 /DNA_ID= /DNA_START= /DNA_END= /DNA_ORIENTATION=
MAEAGVCTQHPERATAPLHVPVETRRRPSRVDAGGDRSDA